MAPRSFFYEIRCLFAILYNFLSAFYGLLKIMVVGVSRSQPDLVWVEQPSAKRMYIPHAVIEDGHRSSHAFSPEPGKAVVRDTIRIRCRTRPLLLCLSLHVYTRRHTTSPSQSRVPTSTEITKKWKAAGASSRVNYSNGRGMVWNERLARLLLQYHFFALQGDTDGDSLTVGCRDKKKTPARRPTLQLALRYAALWCGPGQQRTLFYFWARFLPELTTF